MTTGRSDVGSQQGSADAGSRCHAAFGMLAPGLQRQLYAMRWPSLRPLQTSAIKTYLQTNQDLLLMAETAAGKTEAAFLPVLSAIAQEPTGSVRVMYVGPLKALINDQFARLESLCTHLEMPVHRWHGDVAMSRKAELIKHPSGVLLITPESVESLLVNRTHHLRSLFGGLRAIVIDELHAFLEGERGLHLASLLTRVARYKAPSEPRTRRIGLSATIGDPAIAQRYLSPDAPESVALICDEGGGAEIMIRLHGYDAAQLRQPEANDQGGQPGLPMPEDDDLVTEAMVDDIVEHCRTHGNLIFANAKGDIEILADLANENCRRVGLPEIFLVHHGSLSKEVREDCEARMKAGSTRTAVCSSTLELGIDIGSVRLVGQVGAPWSVASMKQRMGRSGRAAGQARRLRCYIDCTTRAESGNPISVLPLDLLQMIAVCDLMLEGWVEPPRSQALDLSTLTHQIISTIAEGGGVTADDLYTCLCRAGPFSSACKVTFARLLRALATADVVEQGPDGALILGLRGETLRGRRDFYAAFASRSEFTILFGSRVLGTLPIDTLPKQEDHIVFAARRWRVTDVDFERQELHVQPAKRRKRPSFLGSGGAVHHRVVDRMLTVLRSEAPIPYLDAIARETLSRARSIAQEHELASRRISSLGARSCLWLTWAGSAETSTYAALLHSCGIESRNERVALLCECSEADLRQVVTYWTERPPDLRTLAEHVNPKRRRKYDELLPEDLLEDGIATDLVWVAPVT